MDSDAPLLPENNIYMKNKMKYFRTLEQDWVRLSPNDCSSRKLLNLAPPPHLIPSQGKIIIIIRKYLNIYSIQTSSLYHR